jgi:hypothetical protein
MNQVAEKKTASLPANVFEEDAAKGLGKLGQEDLALPFLKILGQLSPEVNKRDGRWTSTNSRCFFRHHESNKD